ncbi:unnamed protein product, partial [Menidia menidia]
MVLLTAILDQKAKIQMRGFVYDGGIDGHSRWTEYIRCSPPHVRVMPAALIVLVPDGECRATHNLHTVNRSVELHTPWKVAQHCNCGHMLQFPQNKRPPHHEYTKHLYYHQQ